MEVPLIYCLTSSDSMGAQVIGCTLNGDNYLTWSLVMLIALWARNKLSFISGSLVKLGDDNPLRERIAPRGRSLEWVNFEGSLLSEASGHRTANMSSNHRGICEHMASEARSSISHDEIEWY
ncbi:hypothetical protein CRG98_038840 [Punica granatum]|uniref:Retrotransposon Copia-like N-terminal domain-containing protein n=1 Tax=Punica granatum TaxID=22663 RepID=A0A2I0IA15_PUNGR|nr:hypothetical protein CRG98_038840 [Punica granatum]